MTISRKLYFTPDVFLYPLLMVLIMWVVFWFEIRFGMSLNEYGIRPGRVNGLRGVLAGPFLHGSLQHLFNNSIPIMVLTTALFYFYRSIRWQVLFLGLLFTGVLTWFIGRPSYHIGASGVVYFLASFLFFKGIFSKHFQLIALSFAVVFVYGSLLWYVFPIKEGVSWEGHLSGFAIGFIFSLIFKNKDVAIKKYEWEREDYNPENDPFMQQFDENGNFIEIIKDESIVDEDNTTTTSQNIYLINYEYNSLNPNETDEIDDTKEK